MEKLKVLDLFSGIGGFSLGLELTGGFETVAFCEIENHAKKILRKHWKNIPIHEDVKALKIDGGIDVITGGFPCQDLSIAGQRKGIVNGERSSLWGEMLRLTRDLRPRYMLAENVTGLLTGDDGQWFGKLLQDLASIRYDVEWHRISAADIGASHCRERVWIVAYPSEVRRKQSIFKRMPQERRDLGGDAFNNADIQGIISWARGETEEFKGLCGKPVRGREDDRVRDWMDRVARCGNSIMPQIATYIGNAILDAERDLA